MSWCHGQVQANLAAFLMLLRFGVARTSYGAFCQTSAETTEVCLSASLAALVVLSAYERS